MGKGSKRRPIRVSQAEYERNWERIFGKPKLTATVFYREIKKAVKMFDYEPMKKRYDIIKECWK